MKNDGINLLFQLKNNKLGHNTLFFTEYDNLQKKNKFLSTFIFDHDPVDRLNFRSWMLGKIATLYTSTTNLVTALVKDVNKSAITITNTLGETIVTDEYSYFVADKKYLRGNYELELVDNTKIAFVFNYGSTLVPEISKREIDFGTGLIMELEMNGNKVFIFRLAKDLEYINEKND